MRTFLLSPPLGEGGRAGWGLSSRHLQGPRLLPSWGSALLRMLEIPTSSWGRREGREGPFGNLGVRPRSGTIFSVHVSWAHSVLWPHLPCTEAGNVSPGLVLAGPISGTPTPCSPGLSARPPAPVPCVLAFGWELGNALGPLWWGLPQASSSRGGRLCRWGALHPRVCRQGACSLSGRKGSGAGHQVPSVEGRREAAPTAGGHSEGPPGGSKGSLQVGPCACWPEQAGPGMYFGKGNKARGLLGQSQGPRKMGVGRDRSDSQLGDDRGPSLAFLAANPGHAVTAFRNVLCVGGAAKEDGQGPRSGGPGRWLAARTLSWLRSASPMDVAVSLWWACIWGCGRESRPLRFPLGGPVSRCLKYLFSKGLTSR